MEEILGNGMGRLLFLYLVRYMVFLFIWQESSREVRFEGGFQVGGSVENFDYFSLGRVFGVLEGSVKELRGLIDQWDCGWVEKVLDC